MAEREIEELLERAQIHKVDDPRDQVRALNDMVIFCFFALFCFALFFFRLVGCYIFLLRFKYLRAKNAKIDVQIRSQVQLFAFLYLSYHSRSIFKFNMNRF